MMMGSLWRHKWAVAVVVIFVKPRDLALRTPCAEGVTLDKHSGPLPEGLCDIQLGAVLRLLCVCCLGIAPRAELLKKSDWLFHQTGDGVPPSTQKQRGYTHMELRLLSAHPNGV